MDSIYRALNVRWQHESDPIDIMHDGKLIYTRASSEAEAKAIFERFVRENEISVCSIGVMSCSGEIPEGSIEAYSPVKV